MGRISGKVFNWPGLDYELITAPNAVQGVQRAVFGSLGQEPVCVSRGCDWQPGLRLPLKLMGGQRGTVGSSPKGTGCAFRRREQTKIPSDILSTFDIIAFSYTLKDSKTGHFICVCGERRARANQEG